MEFEITNILKNIVLVYKELSVEDTKRDDFKAILKSKKVASIEEPDRLLLFAPPPINVVFQIGDRRIITIDQNNKPADKSPICEMAIKANKLDGHSDLIAFGFNYHVKIKWIGKKPVREYLNSRFIKDKQKLASVINGEIISAIPRIRFKRGTNQYDLNFDILDESKLRNEND